MKSVFLMILLFGMGCAGPRYQIFFVDKRDFHPQFPGEKTRLQVYDYDKSAPAPIKKFSFEFKPKRWGKIHPIAGKKNLGQLEVLTLYANPYKPVKYIILPHPKKPRSQKE